ncbi:type I-D CRISPR-associated protein Cas10d/Csc3 [Aliterella atlantica]|nr:type I-D CRISPR-associated protein Cas10d/Csc3 [Aliterella atlantica]
MADNNFDDLPLETLEFDATQNLDDETPIKAELLTIKLFKQAILDTEGNKSDRILENLAENVVPNLFSQLGGATAKGGQFTEDRRAEGKNVERSKHDQSFISHLLNGLLPTYRILKQLRLEQATNPVKRYCNDIVICLFIVSYLLHDFDKFPDYPAWLNANDNEGKFKNRHWQKDQPHKSDAPNFGREYIAKKITDLGLNYLLGDDWEKHIDDIVWLSNNAGVKYDADLGLEIRGLNPKLDGRTRSILASLVRLSDLFASVIKRPGDVDNNGLFEELTSLSNGQLKFSYHSLSDNRGVITNILNNALIEAHPQDFYTALLYLPDGVVYLTKPNAPVIDISNLPNLVIAKIKILCGDRLKRDQTGFGRDGKGFKFADYYWLFFDAIQLMEVSVNAASRLIPSTKSSSAKKRSDSLVAFQNAGDLPTNLNLEFGEDYRIDRLAEFGDTLCRGIWSEWCDRLNTWQKQQPKANRKEIPNLNLTHKLAEYLGLSTEISAIQAIQTLKKTGGVPLDWYYIAAQYFQRNLGLDEAQIRERMTEMVNYAATLIKPTLEQFTISDGWDDIRTYVNRVVCLPAGAVVTPEIQPFLTEISRYSAAKVTGRGRENVCAMSSSSYTVTEQMESATLFAPQVYSNRQILFNAQAAKRQICSIWSIEIMLRQILMNQTNATGGDFEGRKYRYLYLYPAYFFTPETNKFLQKAYTWIERSRFDADIRKYLITEKQEANFTLDNYQKVDALLIKEDLQPENDRTFKISYPENQPLTFFFLALPPGKDATDIESWVMPAWLALALPLVLDIKTVASESPVPPFISGADFEQTVLLDGEHQAIHSLIKQAEYRLDSIVPRSLNQRKFSPLNALSAAYCIHLEVNRKKDGNPDWGKLAALARDLETSPLYVFHYLSKWLRKPKSNSVQIPEIKSVPISKIKLYFDFYYYFEPKGDEMTKLENLTELYRKFYRAKSQYAKANAVLKPIDEAANVVLKIDKALASDNESLTQLVAARLSTLMKNVRRRTAEGKPTLTFIDGKWKPALNSEEERQAIYEFAKYFVEVIFDETFKSDRARLAGMQLNLIRDTCDYLYRLADDTERQQKPQDEPDEIIELEAEATI